MSEASNYDQTIHLVAQLVLHMTLHATQHERLQYHMQTAQLVFVELAAFVLSSVLDVLGEPLVKLIMRVEQAWHNEMQQSPQFYTRATSTRDEVDGRYTHLAWNSEWAYR